MATISNPVWPSNRIRSGARIMSAISVNPPFPFFTDADGQPLDDASIYIGAANQNPVANPIAVYWDEALTIAAVQPIRTSGGYPVYNGTPSRFYVATDYSILVRDKTGGLVFSSQSEFDLLGSQFVSFLQAGTNAVERTVQSKLRDVVSVKDFGAVGDGVADDTIAIQKCIDAVFAAGGGTVYLPPGVYLLSSQGTINIPASDNGSGTATAYNGSTTTSIAAETVNTQAYCLMLRNTVRFIGAGNQATILKGPYTSGASLTSPIGLAFSDVANYEYGRVAGVRFQSFFIGIGALATLINETEFEDLMFLSCGISAITRYLERNSFNGVHFFGSQAGWVNGGFWTTRCDNYTEQGGWADKNTFENITGQSLANLSSATVIDTYFDTYFFKTANNTTRKYPSGGSGTPATVAPFKGIAGRSISFLSRYYRPNAANRCGSIRHMQAFRPPFYFGGVSGFSVDSVYLEVVGFATNVKTGPVVGDLGYEDPYRSGRYADLLSDGAFGLFGGVSVTFMEAQFVGATSVLPFNSSGFEIKTARVTGENETTPSSPNKRISLIDYSTDTVRGSKTIEADQLMISNRIGYRILSAVWFQPVAGTVTATFTLPATGVYTAVIRLSGNGALANSRWGTFILTWSVLDSSFFVSEATQIGTWKSAGGPSTPNVPVLTAPTSAGLVSIAVTASAQVNFDVFISRIG